jgi:two-component sensor histidine kinase
MVTFCLLCLFACSQKDIQKNTPAGQLEAQARSFIDTGNTFGSSHTEFNKKIAYFEQAVSCYHQSGNRLQEATIRQLVADLYGNDGEFDKALLLMDTVMAIYKELNYKKLQEAYSLIGSLYLTTGNNIEGRRYLLLSAKTAEDINDTTGFMVTAYNRLGIAYFHVEDYKTSEEYFQKALVEAEARHDTAAITNLANNIADTKSKLGQFAASNAYFKKHLAKYPVSPGDHDRLAITSIILLANDIALKDFRDAKIRYNTLLSIHNSYDINDPDFQFIKLPMVTYLQATGQYRDTYKYLDAYKKNFLYGRNLKRSARFELLYAISDSALGRQPAAMRHYQLYKAFSDSAQTLDKTKQQEELRLQYETDKKDKNIALQNIKLRESRNLVFLLIGGAVILLLFIALLLNRNRLKQRTNKQINDQNELLRKLVNDKEWLMKEIHHRVKNNLQIAISLLNTQSNYLESEDAVAALQNSRRRIYAMSLVHQRLYQTDDLARIDMKWYITGLVEFLQESLAKNDRISFYVDCDPVSLDVVHAVPLGLIINEAICNAVKYAFTGKTKGKIYVSFTQQQDYILTISDDGIGFDVSTTGTNSLGMTLIHGLAEQLDGQLAIRSDSNGVTITILVKNRL